ncbi:MAG: MCE family protein, partial [Opitutaceae bacterium]|nr:MCE family protein [Cytophagales bacterium]
SLSTEEMMSTFQANNKNVLEITNDLKSISKNLANGNGSIGKLLKDETIYNNISATTASLQSASNKATKMMTAMSEFSSKLNKKGTLANELVTDTQVFKSVRESVYQLNKIADSASAVVNNMKRASENTKTPVGVLLHDEQAGANLKATLKNLESGSAKLDEDLEALQHNFLLRGYFKKQTKQKTNP